MDLLAALGRVVPFAFASGVNVYATVAVIGLSSRFGLVALPEQYQIFGNPWVIGIAVVMYGVEFVADKVPWVDSVWDAVHTVIRPLGGALVAVTTLGDAAPSTKALIAVLGGSVAMTTHLTKAGTRAVVNSSPEPFSNWILSLVEDVFVIGLTWFAMEHPLMATITALVLLVAIVVVGATLWRVVRRRFSRAGEQVRVRVAVAVIGGRDGPPGRATSLIWSGVPSRSLRQRHRPAPHDGRHTHDTSRHTRGLSDVARSDGWCHRSA